MMGARREQAPRPPPGARAAAAGKTPPGGIGAARRHQRRRPQRGPRPPMSPTEGRRTAAPPDPSHFRHSYSKDKSQLIRRLSRTEGQGRGIARMIEREEYCVDILQQTAALRAAVDSLSILVLEDHVGGCVRGGGAEGQGDGDVGQGGGVV